MTLAATGVPAARLPRQHLNERSRWGCQARLSDAADSAHRPNFPWRWRRCAGTHHASGPAAPAGYSAHLPIRKQHCADACLRADVHVDPRCHAPGQRERSKIPDYERVRTSIVECFEVCGQFADIARIHERVQRHVHLHAVLVGKSHHSRHLVEREVVGTRAHAETVACQVHGIGAETHGRLQLRPSARRSEQLGFVVRRCTQPGRPAGCP